MGAGTFDGKTIFISGGTGTLGRRLVRTLLAHHDPKKLVVYSRDELKQFEMREELRADALRFFIGDVRDPERLRQAMRGADHVVHAAALKQVPVAEYNPMECIKTNVYGTQNVIEAALANDVQKVVFVSTDKAVNPINLYGASKLAAEKLTIAANNVSGGHPTRFSVVRYGNVIGSRGSVLPFFRQLLAKGVRRLPVTDARMTRFWFSLDDGVQFVLDGLARMRGGETFVPRIPSMRVVDLVESLAPGRGYDEVGIRPGEKIQKVLCPSEDAHLTLAFARHFVIRPRIRFYDREVDYARDPLGEAGTPVEPESEFTSGTNPRFLSVAELRALNEATPA